MQNTALRLALRAPQDTSLIVLHRSANLHFVKDHMIIRAANFVSKAIENNTLCGREVQYYLNLYSEEQLANTPLGLIRNAIV